jgi:LmbE family N-acetylglucosaminyl deacetylase
MTVAHLFLSPHFDDVALSCGGTVARLAAAGMPVGIVTVFGGDPPPEMPLTPYAREHLPQWGVRSVAEAFATRRHEDAAATATLGATLHTLPFVDGAFRGDRYRSWDELRAHLHPAEASLPGEIAAAILASGLVGAETVITGPLAIGRHVDHQAVFAATDDLATRGYRIRGYEDYPYAADAAEYAARIRAAALAQATPEIVEITPWLETKIRAIACYPSQLPSLFRDMPMPEAVRGYGARVADGAGVAERFWWPAMWVGDAHP